MEHGVYVYTIGEEKLIMIEYFMSTDGIRDYLEEHSFITLEDKIYRTCDISKVEKVPSEILEKIDFNKFPNIDKWADVIKKEYNELTKAETIAKHTAAMPTVNINSTLNTKLIADEVAKAIYNAIKKGSNLSGY